MTSTPKDVNSKQSNNVVLGKRKKVREKRGNYLQKWLDKSMQCTLDSIPDIDPCDTNMNANYWNAQASGMYGQRLFNATSDPSVFRYSTPFPYPQEPHSLPLFSHLYSPNIPTLFPNYNVPQYPQPAVRKIQQRSANKKKNNTNKQNGIESDLKALQNGSIKSKSNTSSVIGGNNDFASLPPGINQFPDNLSNICQEDSNSENKRRFSDPGVVQNESLDASNDDSLEGSDDESSVNGGSHVETRLVMCLVDQISALKDSNRKLQKELYETRAELDALKQQNPLWRADSLPRHSPQPGHLSGGLANSSTVYSPGMLADLVREIRDAARLREEAVYSKVRTLLDERSSHKINGNISMEKNMTDWRHYEPNYKNQNHLNGIEKSRYNDVISKLEELRLQQSREEAGNHMSFSGSCGSPMSLPHQHNIDLDKARLRAELSKEKAAREAADAHVHKLELMVTQLSKRNHQSNTHTPTHHMNTSMGGASSDGLHMVLGPVTDL